MSISIKDVERVAKLAKLELNDTEKQQFTEQLKSFLQHANELKQLDTDGVKPTIRATDMKNVLRADEVRPSLPIERVMDNAPDEDEGQFRVPAIIE